MGLAAVTDGWFTVNIRDAAWITNDAMGAACIFEGHASFPEVGYTLAVLQPGQPSGMYHSESDQEDFLVLAGECLLLVEETERQLRAWDFFHCEAGTKHAFVGAGEQPCVIFMAGGRSNGRATQYHVTELARRHGAAAPHETSESEQAYSHLPAWRPGPPTTWDGLPWG